MRRFLTLLALLCTLAPAASVRGQAVAQWTNLAGQQGGEGFLNGTGRFARFYNPSGVAVDGTGNVFVADMTNCVIRKITPDGVVTTLAGSSSASGSADGTGTAARFDRPVSIAIDGSGHLYVGDSGNKTLRKITPEGVVTTLAGSPDQEGSADGVGSAARFSFLTGVAVDGSGNIYVADYGNHTIRKITSDGTVSTLAGSAGVSATTDGTGSAARFSAPAGVAVDGSGTVYVAEYSGSVIRQITPAGVVSTLAGKVGTRGSVDGTGAAAQFNSPHAITIDGSGNIYVADYGNHTIRKITNGGLVSTLAGFPGSTGNTDGVGTAARFNHPDGLAVDAGGNLYVADVDNAVIRKVTSDGTVTTFAGSGPNAGYTNGIGLAARFAFPTGVAVDGGGTVYVVGNRHCAIRKITVGGVVTTLAGNPGLIGSTDGPGEVARFFFPEGVAVDGSGNIYVADTGNRTIRKITSDGVVSTLAGSSVGMAGSTDGTGSAARFTDPKGLAVDGSGNIYVADTGNHTIRKITRDGVVTTLAGSAGLIGSADGTGAAARFRRPGGVAVDGSGTVYVADTENFTIRKITSNRVVTTLAGRAGVFGYRDGAGSDALFWKPSGVAADSIGSLYVTDEIYHAIRRITSGGVVTTIGGGSGYSGGADGLGEAAQFSSPTGIAAGAAGHVFVADTYNNRITEGVLDPTLPTLSPVEIASNNPHTSAYARVGDAVTVTFTASKAIQTPTATIAGKVATMTNVEGNQWTASVTISGAPSGVAAISIAFKDLEGNAGTPVTGTTDGSNVTIDLGTQAPTAILAPGGTVSTVAVTFDLREAPLPGSVKLLFKTSGTQAMREVTLAATQEVVGTRTVSFDPANPTASTQVASGAPIPDGDYTVIISYQDVAGNAAATRTVGFIRIDTAAPVISMVAIAADSQRPAWVTDMQIVRVTFTTSEDHLTLVGASIGGQPATLKMESALRWQISAQMMETVSEGPVAFSVKVKDAAANASTTVTTTSDGSVVKLDRTAPVVGVPSPVAEATSASGAVVNYTLGITDNLDPAPTLRDFGPKSGDVFPLGETLVYARVSDGAGNEVHVPFTVTVVDTTKPAASVPGLLRVAAGATGTAAIGDLTGNVTRSDLVTPVAGLVVTQTPDAATVYGLGTYPVSFEVKDVVGNTTTLASMVQVGFVRPDDPVVTPGPKAGPLVRGAAVPGAGAGDIPVGATFAGFSTPALSDARRMVARAKVLAGRKSLAAIYGEDGAGAGEVVAIQNGEALDADGQPFEEATFKGFLDPITSPGGVIAFAAKLQGKGAKAGDDGVWSDVFSPDELRLILREGAAMPGLENGERLKAVTSLSLRDGELLALVKLATAKDVVSAKNDAALVLVTAPGAGTVLLREGTELGGEDGATIKSFSVLQPALGSHGQGRWHGEGAVLAKVTLEDGEVRLVKLAPDGAVTSLLSTAAAPSLALAEFDPEAKWKSFGLPAMGRNGTEFAVAAALLPKAGATTTKDDSVLLFSADGAAWTIFAREGQVTPITAPDDGPRYATFFDPIANGGGQVAFLATMEGTGVSAKTKTGLFCGTPDHLRLAARLGVPAPDERGALGEAVWSKFITHALPSGPGADVVFVAELSGAGVTAKNKLGLWAADSTGSLRCLMRTGEPLVTDGPMLSSFTLLTATPSAYGTARSYNETASIAVLATFGDKSQMLLRLDLP